MNMKGVFFFAGYILVFIAALWAVIWWDRRRRRTRPPFPENLKLLRMPGEYLWRRVIKGDEVDMQWLLAAIVIPILVGGGALRLGAGYLQSSPTTVLIVAASVFVFSLLLSVRWFQTRLQRRADDYLGFFGERYVAEWLDPLKATAGSSSMTFHARARPGNSISTTWPLDPGGVWVVETKTRRKGRARAGFKEHEVVFDGVQIIWPWGEDTFPLKQASANARWLREWLQKLTGRVIDIAAVLTFPGYCVIERKLGPVRLANPKGLPQVLISRGKALLPEEEIDLILRRIEDGRRRTVFARRGPGLAAESAT